MKFLFASDRCVSTTFTGSSVNQLSRFVVDGNGKCKASLFGRVRLCFSVFGLFILFLQTFNAM